MLKSFFHKSEGYSRSVQIASNYPTFHFKPCLTPIFKECWVTEAFARDGYRAEANGVHYYHPQTNLWKGNVFTPVCQSFCSQGRVSAQGGVYPSMHWTDPPGQTPPPHPPWRPLQRTVSSLLECILVLYRMFVCEGYVFTRVCHSVHGGGVCPIACWDTPPRPEAGTPHSWSRHPPLGTRGRHPPGPEAGTPPPEQTTLGADTPRDQRQVPPPVQCMLGDTGNKRAVRILLECNLVLHRMFYIAYEPRGSGQVLGGTGYRLISRTRSCTSWSVSMGFSCERFLLDIGPGSAPELSSVITSFGTLF